VSKNNNEHFEKRVRMHIAPGKIRIKENIDMFKCPFCGEGMNFDNLNSLICNNNHCFDIAKSGYVNFLLKSLKQKYDKELFESRNLICKMGFFDPLVEKMACLIAKNVSRSAADGLNHIRILDAGCGEGYHLSEIIKKLQEKDNIDLQGAGIDISKYGIQLASKNHKDIIWCVADIAKIPFLDNKFDIVLNILSPANYSEFGRVIRSNGLLIKAVPNSGYLKELRNKLYQGTDKEAYSNEKVIEHFSRYFEIREIKSVLYKVSISKEELNHLIKMTPLSWGAAEEMIEKASDSKIENITADFTIIIGKSRL
jgi:23S rRNA (guanine745-N1)-methyltransferase